MRQDNRQEVDAADSLARPVFRRIRVALGNTPHTQPWGPIGASPADVAIIRRVLVPGQRLAPGAEAMNLPSRSSLRWGVAPAEPFAKVRY
jgi:hypothetical protein